MIAIRERERESLSRKIEHYNELALSKMKESRSILGRLMNLRRSALESQARMDFLEKESGRLQGSMAQLNLSIAETSNLLADLLIKLRTRIVDMYKYSSQERLDVLLATRSTHEALIMAYMLRRLANQDQKVVETLARKADELEQSREKLEKSRAQVQRQQTELKKKRDEFAATIQRTNVLLKNVQGEQKKAKAAAQELMSAQQAIGDKIIALMQEKGARGRREERAPAPSPAPPASPGAPAPQKPQRQPQQYTYLANGAVLEWPLQGPIAMAFGSRVHPVFKTKVFNSGIDIRAASGAPVRAAGPGRCCSPAGSGGSARWSSSITVVGSPRFTPTSPLSRSLKGTRSRRGAFWGRWETAGPTRITGCTSRCAAAAGRRTRCAI
ncbi:hypothetical protein SY1_22590 [Fretibacterium fastidiosum]|uniref:Membrane-bound metallopeptidase n=1 Tax=Fretibacterium fastidiosum TaxID=651822 RepID=A0AB94IYT3_9BACT|nr:hypothetical protein [Fretibacterium fastidiosum]CBL28946.1 hypothetical protein SY1_22590 [Fretibacterium fastidiosum]